MISLAAPMLSDAEDQDAEAWKLLAKSHAGPFPGVRFALTSGGQLWVVLELFGRHLHDTHLALGIELIAKVADEQGDVMAEQFRGHRIRY